MSDEEITNGMGDYEKGFPLETIDLKTSEGPQQPVLEFNPNSYPISPPGEPTTPPAQAISPIQMQGTELRGRQRTTSSGSNFKEWGVHQFKITKQMVQERFGHGTRTIDSSLEKRIESLRDTQKKYAHLISLSNQFHVNFQSLMDTEKSMAEHFAFMSIRAPELHAPFHYNSETQKIISRNGDTLLAAMKQFSSNLQTVCSKTMEDTLQTIKGYEAARLSYDTYRTECDNVRRLSATSQKAATSLQEVNAEFEKHKEKFEKLRADVDIKLKLLDENKLKVTHNQLILLQEAFAAYFSSNHEAVDALLQEFKEKVEESEASNDPPAWLEDLPSQHS